MDRHRLIALALKAGFISFEGQHILHFAPEPALARMIEASAPSRYRTADLEARAGGEAIDITAMDLPDANIDLVLAIHVLEHVDDAAALGEIRRVLRPGGQALLMAPVAEGWAETFEDATIEAGAARHRYFAQSDHVRYFGADIRERMRAAGFDLAEFTASGRQSGDMGIARGETLFRATRPA